MWFGSATGCPPTLTFISMQTNVTVEKSLPHSLEAERAVLGAILLDNALFDQTSQVLTTIDFYLENHRNIFSAMERLSSSARAIDSLTLREELQKRNELESMGGSRLYRLLAGRRSQSLQRDALCPHRQRKGPSPEIDPFCQ